MNAEKQIQRKKIMVNMGEVKISNSHILQTFISTCVSVCLYHPELKIGGMTHISRSRENDTTPSGKFLKKSGFYYADRAIPELLLLLKQEHPSIRDNNLKFIITGGINNENTVIESLAQLEKYAFKLAGSDTNRNLYRNVVFDVQSGTVAIFRKKPFSQQGKIMRFYF